MVKKVKIIWTDFAIKNLKDIYDYHAIIVNKKVANKIRIQIFEATKQLTNNPESGQIELNLEKLKKNHRYLVSGNYKIIYRFLKTKLLSMMFLIQDKILLK